MLCRHVDPRQVLSYVETGEELTVSTTKLLGELFETMMYRAVPMRQASRDRWEVLPLVW